MGYVIKTHAGNDLLVAMEAVRDGMQFVSGGLALGAPSVFARNEPTITQE